MSGCRPVQYRIDHTERAPDVGTLVALLLPNVYNWHEKTRKFFWSVVLSAYELNINGTAILIQSPCIMMVQV